MLALSGRTNRCALVRPAATHTARRFGRIPARERAYRIHLVARPVPPSVSPPLARPARRVRTASRAPRRCRIREALASIRLGLGALVLSTRDASPSGGRGEEARARRPMALRHHPDAPRRHPAPRVPPAASASRRGRAALGALGRAPGIPRSSASPPTPTTPTTPTTRTSTSLSKNSPSSRRSSPPPSPRSTTPTRPPRLAGPASSPGARRSLRTPFSAKPDRASPTSSSSAPRARNATRRLSPTRLWTISHHISLRDNAR